ncbi:3-hydroxybutyryl-CoA dehydrogenase [Kitasatospora sp. MAA4]|uniref:3-hydroxybutyryl-CoA dehydrogenase n=1 Tax=Kitasatospora sp. MAA4 TaxID=3035093 RepID=UPI00247606F4|nr:3-hydroxybutyryl-CoA dehydrogenase [Kitasatospora sp. MAA4]MDH6135473.1 3-hydroxybutyryl-CoA dehydrogenase [Kitasatospora sp. MAA4]
MSAPAGIHRVGVVGCGAMGSGIAEVCAGAGLDVRVAVRTPDALEAGRGRLLRSLDRSVRKGRLSEQQRGALLARVEFSTDLADLADRQLVVEAIREQEEDKVQLFAQLDKLVTADDAILASNTSSVPIVRLALATGRPGQVLGLHFFSPVPAMPLVELIGSPFTGAEAHERARLFVGEVLGKTAILSPDRTGFVVNALLIPYLLNAIRMVQSGLVSAETVDQGMVLGCSHPVGPLKLADLIGLDVVAQIAAALHDEFGEPQYAAPDLLSRMVAGGLLGRKSGRGFYAHP